MIRQWFFGFHRPVYTKPSLWLGHCEAWGFQDDGTYLFIDPQGAGLKVYTSFLNIDIECQLAARAALCHEILTLPAQDASFRLPLHGPMTCAGICGSLVGIRALLPSTLRRRLLAKGAEVLHETERGSG